MTDAQQDNASIIEQLLGQLSFLDALNDMDENTPIAQRDEAIQASVQAYRTALDLDVLMGKEPVMPGSLAEMQAQILESIQRFQGLVLSCAPYLACAEDALTAPDGSNPFMRYGLNYFFAVLNGYIQLFAIEQIPPALDEAEKARFVSFLEQFLIKAEMDGASCSSSVENLDQVTAILDTLVREGGLDAILTGEEKRRVVLSEARQLAPITRSPIAYMPISKVSRNQLLAASELLSVDVGGGVSVQSSIQLSAGVVLDEFDIEIQNTIGEMIQHNQDNVLTATPAQIFRECAALMDREKVGPDMEQQVIASIDKMLRTSAVLDVGDQFIKHKRIKRQSGVDYDSVRFEGHLIEGRKMTVSAGGHLKIAYRIYDKPMYYAYSHAIGQIAALDKKLLNTSQSGAGLKTRKNTREFVVLKRVLAREIERMKKEYARNKGAYEDRLSYTRIQKEIGLASASEKQLRTMRADVDYLCEYWIEQKYIKGYEKYKVARAFAGVRIAL